WAIPRMLPPVSAPASSRLITPVSAVLYASITARYSWSASQRETSFRPWSNSESTGVVIAPSFRQSSLVGADRAVEATTCALTAAPFLGYATVTSKCALQQTESPQVLARVRFLNLIGRRPR